MGTKEVAPVKLGLVARVAQRFGVDPEKLLGTLKATAFRVKKTEDAPAEVSNEQMMALLIVSEQYGLNPFTKEIFAFPDKYNGIVPVVSVDGWNRIANEHSQFDGLEFRYSDQSETHANKEVPTWIECIVHRRDRAHPTVIREFFSECVRNTTTWSSHPTRMLRHKAMIQALRVAFGFAGIYDEDEAARIIDVNIAPASVLQRPRAIQKGLDDSKETAKNLNDKAFDQPHQGHEMPGEATDGERAWIKRKLEAIGYDEAKLFKEANLEGSVANMTLDQFTVLRDKVVEIEAR